MNKYIKNEKGFSVVEALIVLVIVGLVSSVGWLVWDRQKTDKPAESSTPTSSNSSGTTQATNGSVTSQKYKDETSGLSFKIPEGWSKVDTVPTKYKAKMFQRSCEGPVLVKNDDIDVLIASEIKTVNGDGDFCWSSGDFSQGNKWISLETKQWVGDFFLQTSNKISNDKYRAFFMLVNYQTNTLRGESDFNTVINSAKF